MIYTGILVYIYIYDMIVIHTIYYRYLDFFFHSYVTMISSKNGHFTLAGSWRSPCERVNFFSFTKLDEPPSTRWCPQTLCLLVHYKPH